MWDCSCRPEIGYNRNPFSSFDSPSFHDSNPFIHASQPRSSASSDSMMESAFTGSVEITGKEFEKLVTVDEVHSIIIKKHSFADKGSVE